MDDFFRPLAPSTSQDGPSWMEAPFLARLAAVYTLTSADVEPTGRYPGMAAGTNVYAFIEQAFDPTTGTPQDSVGGRFTPLDPSTGRPLTAFALEENNLLLAAPGSTPAGYASPGPYVDLRFKSLVGGSPCYQFSGPPGLAWVAVGAASPGAIYTGRKFADAVLNGTTTLVSPAQAQFGSADVGEAVVGYGIAGRTVYDASFTSGSTTLGSVSAGFASLDVGQPLNGTMVPVPAGTTISSVTSSQVAVMSHAATATQANVQVQIGNPTTISSVTNATTAILSQAALTSLTGGTLIVTASNCPGYAGGIVGAGNCGAGGSGLAVWFREVNGRTPDRETYQCRFLGEDAYGVQVWGTRFEPPLPILCNDGPATVGPVLVGLTCSNNNLVPTWGYLTGCGLALCTNNCGSGLPAAPPPCPPSANPSDDFGSVWGQ